MASQYSPLHDHDRNADSSRYPGTPEPRGGAYAYGGGPNEGHSTTFAPEPGEDSAPPSMRRQPRADDHVHYTTSPFQAPRPVGGQLGVPIDPHEKRGFLSRAAGTWLLATSAVVAAAALVLTVLMQVYIAVPLFLIAGALFYSGKGSLRESSYEATEPVHSDPGRRREPDVDD